MNPQKFLPWLAVVLILAKWLAEVWLAALNRRQVLAHASAVPAAFKNLLDEATYARSVQYTLDRKSTRLNSSHRT